MNYKYFALTYLNDWHQWDRHFVQGLSSDDRETRLRAIHEAAKYYRIARNFKRFDEVRLDSALESLDAVTGPITEENVDSVVCGLAKTFEARYGKYAISAASKLLWIRHKSPVVIYDGQAFKSLNSGGTELRQGYYKPYRTEWRRQFAQHADAIRSACTEVVHVRCFSLAHGMPIDEATRLTAEQWIHERVFDKFLWSFGST